MGPALISLGESGTGLADNPLRPRPSKMGINIEIVVNPYLDWTTDFCRVPHRRPGQAADLPGGVSRSRSAVKGPGSEYEHDTDRNQFGIKRSCNVGYGYWQFAAKATLS